MTTTVLLSRPTEFYVNLLLLFRKAHHPLITCRQVPQALLPAPKDTQVLPGRLGLQVSLSLCHSSVPALLFPA